MVTQSFPFGNKVQFVLYQSCGLTNNQSMEYAAHTLWAIPSNYYCNVAHVANKSYLN